MEEVNAAVRNRARIRRIPGLNGRLAFEERNSLGFHALASKRTRPARQM